uniref:SET domain-containing protein n=1 Tax=Chaetoceros debilis TaxID=122233 RepID=A0A7S3PWC5_9STRA|mmetsp:Transcript_24397/g.37297  ORF Transcript_24397/g.37297 Transcript_24397/m.37297 type:complete len:145 (-) Transcript_24397:250-684(-)|eukprot:CAMPEP_0194078950 /NCGR_PEP_ID=MMETSP0149-20130528/5234_1 /TAXON_ID=122233 /ORGANISM="Chaetoceros debilis, Strain MM31A-1" /LENGTH=144 /DNA_ID=CAMNT_0038760307 /DNA_START=84 /DNA_END=518 /DNA_ORIENTATION=+
MASHPENKIDCSKVYVKKSSFSNDQTGDFDGAFAAVDIKKDELIEAGVVRRLPDGFDGMSCPYIFTWSTERPNKTWAMASGCAPYYNTCKEGTSNTRMVRDFEKDNFEIFANEDIKVGDELLHTYISLKWRTCFSELNDIVHKE